MTSDPERIVRLEDDAVVVLDQRRLPEEVVELRCTDAAELAEAIRSLAVRGAPAIGVAAAYGLALAATRGHDVDDAYEVLAGSRPTAVNLRWALDEMRADPTPERARRIHEDEVARCVAMGAHAAAIVPPAARILTHCNAGGLATGGYGSAVGAIRAAAERGGVVNVWVDETRPLLQGARLTAFELEALGIPHAVIVDSAAASRMAAGEVDIVITGADRIAANGDTANKIGTYGLAVLAHHHEIPFVIVAPTSTIDPARRRRRRDPDRGARRRRGHDAVCRPQSRLRRHAGGADHGDRDRGGRAPRAVRALASRSGALPVILDEVDPASRAILEAHGFDAETFERLRRELADGTLRDRGNVVQGIVEPPLGFRPDAAARTG